MKIISSILAVLIIFALSMSIFILHFVIEDLTVRIIGTIAIIALVSAWLGHEYYKRRLFMKSKIGHEVLTPITRFILISADGEREKEWHCEGVSSFLVGKGTTENAADIELGDTQYGKYIANEHAILNNLDGIWYIEDLGSMNGVGIKKRGEEYTLRLKPNIAYKVDEGDILFISKIKILAR